MSPERQARLSSAAPWGVPCGQEIPAQGRKWQQGGRRRMGVLTGEQVERFHRDGYLKFGRVLEPAQVERMRAALDRIIAEELASEGEADRPPEFAYGHDRKGQDPTTSGRAPRKIHQFVNIWKV